MTGAMRPCLRLIDDETARAVKAEAIDVLGRIGVFVEYEPAREMLAGSGAKADAEGRILIPPDLVEKALESAPSEITLFDRDGENALRLGGDDVAFDPGSAAIKVREPTSDDCVDFARLADALEYMAMQSTCVIPKDVPHEIADRQRLQLALRSCRKPVITGTFGRESYDAMYEMLVCVRGGGDRLREKPLAIFDCCPSPPLKWSELTCQCLVECAKRGVPAELVSMPLTGATAPATLLGAVVQHTAENLSGVVIHQLAASGAPIIYGGSPSGFDLRKGTTPMGAIETMMIDVTYSQIGKMMNLPTHAYMGLSDSKLPDWQAGMEGGIGAMLAALAGINVVSGPGMLDFESCQSLENLLLQNEACGMAHRLIKGVARRDNVMALDILKQGLAQEQFLSLDHTRKWFREELFFPGPSIDRDEGGRQAAQAKLTAAERAHAEVKRLLSRDKAPGLDDKMAMELEKLAGN